MAEDIKRPNGNRWQTKIDEDLAGNRWQTKIDEDLAGNRWQTKIDEDLARPLNDDFNSAYLHAAKENTIPRDIECVVAVNVKLGMEIIWDAWGPFSIQNLFVSMHVVIQLLNMSSLYQGNIHITSPASKSSLFLSVKFVINLYETSFFCLHYISYLMINLLLSRLMFYSPYTHAQIPTNGIGLIKYRCHPFWSQKYCPSHEHDNTARCCSCERFESWSTRYISLGDGRSIYLECMESAIMDTGDCQPLYHAIRDYYEGMNMRIDQQIPMLLVERQTLNEAIEGEKLGFHHMPETRGLCLSEEQIVTSMQRRPRMEHRGLVGIITQPQKLSRKCEVTAILVLYGLPRLLTGAILAHELMHGWLRLNGYRNLQPEVEEGICQVPSHMWLESEVIPGTRNTPCSRLHQLGSMDPQACHLHQQHRHRLKKVVNLVLRLS